jgi:hypothetical protein
MVDVMNGLIIYLCVFHFHPLDLIVDTFLASTFLKHEYYFQFTQLY